MPSKPIYAIWDTKENRQVCPRNWQTQLGSETAHSDTLYGSREAAMNAAHEILDARLKIEEMYYRNPVTHQPVRDADGNFERGFIDRQQLEEWGYPELYDYEIKELPGFLLYEERLRKRYLAGDSNAALVVERRMEANLRKAAGLRKLRELADRKKAERDASKQLLGVQVPVEKTSEFNHLAILLNVGTDRDFPSAATRENFTYDADTPREILDDPRTPHCGQILDLPQAAGAMLFHMPRPRAMSMPTSSGEVVSLKPETVSAHELYASVPKRKLGRPPSCLCGQCYKCATRAKANAYQRSYRARRQRESERYWAEREAQELAERKDRPATRMPRADD